MEKALMFLSLFLGFLSVVMALVLSWNTNKLVKTEDERAKKMIDEGNRRTQEMIAEMDKRHRETMEYLGSLIKADGEKTRELINKVLEKLPG